MIDKFDYAEPKCPLSSGKDFYYPDKDAPSGRIPVGRIISKVDSLFNKNDYAEAGRLLNFWKKEAIDLKDKNGQLAIENELIGFYRKQHQKEDGLQCIKSALELVEALNQGDLASGATVFINCATAYKEFGMSEQSLPLYTRAEQIYNDTIEKWDSRFGGLYNNMALTLVDLGEFERAEQAYNNALEVMQRAPRGELECSITYINMAHMFEQTGELEKIWECMEKGKQLLQKQGLLHDGYYAFVIEKCAPSFEYFGDKATCDQFKKEAAEIYARA